jgi:3-methyladenine DNA glycosylase Mpg
MWAFRGNGLHWMLNVVTGPIDYPAAVLIRSVDGIVVPQG